MRISIGISAGDPAGIGLEVTLKALPSVLNSVRWILFTTPHSFEKNRHLAPSLPHRWVDSPSAINNDPVLFLHPISDRNIEIPWGTVHPDAGAEAIDSLRIAGEAALSGIVDAVVTAPVHKYAIGGGFKGQTDFLAEQAGRQQYAMAFFAPTFKVVLATVHMSLRDALNRISTEMYVELIRFVDAELNRFHFEQRRIAVAGINPHAGEGGVFGDEEERILKPAVEQCIREGISVWGPLSADSLYYLAHTGRYDVVIAPYHDQGLAPLKLIAHGQSTNVTLGLPYVRTSPDHGTAFDIAGKGTADPEGMLSAMKCALELVRRVKNPM
jgi:4-hydroxythreonine-4-phosphate dehydrogenase